MKFLAVALLVIVGTSATQNELETSSFEAREARVVAGAIISAIEDLSRQIRQAGYDPYVIARRSVESYYPQYDALVRYSIVNLLATGASNIAIHNVDYSILFNRLRFDLSLPELFGTVEHAETAVTVGESAYDGQIQGSLSIQRIRLRGEIRVNVGIISGITIRSINLNFSLGPIASDIAVIYQGHDYSAAVNELLNVIIPRYVVDNADQINSYLEGVAWIIAGLL